MPPQGNNQYLTELEIRFWIRDNDPEANLLIDDFEFSSEEIRMSMTQAVDRWNDTPPYIGAYSVNNFPYRNALIQGTTANLLTIAGHRYRRNDLQYNIPGGAINDQNKAESYDSAAARLAQTYGTWIDRNKRSLNMEMGWSRIEGIDDCGDY